MRLLIDPAPFPALAGYRIGLKNETYAPDSQDLTLPDTDAQGHVDAADRAAARAGHDACAEGRRSPSGVNDPSGHASLATTDIPVRPAGRLIGIKPAFAGGAVDAGTEAAFDIAAVGPDGTRVATAGEAAPGARAAGLAAGHARQPGPLRDGVARRTAGDADITIPADAPYRVRAQARLRPLPASRSLEDGGMAATSVRFRSGWVSSDSPDVPDQVDVSADRKSYAPGETARIHIAPPFAGEATLLVLSDRVHSVRNTRGARRRHRCRCAGAGATGAPGAYVAVHVFRTAADAPARGPAAPSASPGSGVDPGAPQTAGRVRGAGEISAARRARRSGCAPRPAPGSAWPRSTRASCG